MTARVRLSILSVTFVTLSATLFVAAYSGVDESQRPEAAPLRGQVVEAVTVPDSPLLRAARRLQQRMLHRGFSVYSIPVLQQALAQRQRLLSRSVALQFIADDGTDFGTYDASVAAHPGWINAVFGASSFSFALNVQAIERDIELALLPQLPAPVDSTLSSVTEDGELLRVSFDHPAEPGYVLPGGLGALVQSAIEGTAAVAVVSPRFTPGVVRNETGLDLGPLQYLAQGRSNFAGSGWGRISNVRKGLHDYINGVLIPPGTVFSFNEAVHNMNLSEGWEEALAIMNGTDLVPIPGGGICQVATTTYRAALLAGLPIEDRASHSLYVTYYEKYGVGIDATIFPGKQDFTFRNDTGHYLLLQAYSREYEAAVNVYGMDTGRQAVLEGPYFAGSDAAELAILLERPLASNEIAWIRSIQLADGTTARDLILSRYKSIPQSLKQRYASGENGGA